MKKINQFSILLNAWIIFMATGLSQAAILTHYTFDNNIEDTGYGATTDNLITIDTDSDIIITTGYDRGVIGNAVKMDPGEVMLVWPYPNGPNDFDLTMSYTMELYYKYINKSNEKLHMHIIDRWDVTNDWVWAFGSTLPPHPAYPGFQTFSNFSVDGDLIRGDHGIKFPDDGEWHHIAITSDPEKGLHIWQDGVVIDSAAYPLMIPGTSRVRFGRDLMTTYMDDFILWDEAKGTEYMQYRYGLIPEPAWSSALLAGLAFISVGFIRLKSLHHFRFCPTFGIRSCSLRNTIN